MTKQELAVKIEAIEAVLNEMEHTVNLYVKALRKRLEVVRKQLG